MIESIKAIMEIIKNQTENLSNINRSIALLHDRIKKLEETK